MYRILAINPGSTSTKIGLFQDEELLFKESVEHTNLDKYTEIMEQREMRFEAVTKALERHGYEISSLDATVGRGGFLAAVHTGGYRVSERMKNALRNTPIAPHASNLGSIIADDIAEKAGGIPAFIYDAISACEFPDFVQVTGHPDVRRRSFCHVLNSRAVAIRHAKSLGRRYEDMNFIVAHMGGGITNSAHMKGSIVDSLADDNGPFGPERLGGIPLLDFIENFAECGYTKRELKKLVRGGGGLKAHFGTTDCRVVEEKMRGGDEYAKLVLTAMNYQIAKGIALVSPIFKGGCNNIILTGGLARSKFITGAVTEYVSYIAPVVVIPGEYELEALAGGALRILRGEEEAREY